MREPHLNRRRLAHRPEPAGMIGLLRRPVGRISRAVKPLDLLNLL
jgi:hypothetical protein